jgi:parvulin-like peptidyl-prolyl isomerase
MAEGWKQIWEDVLNALRGREAVSTTVSAAEETRLEPQVELEDVTKPHLGTEVDSAQSIKATPEDVAEPQLETQADSMTAQAPGPENVESDNLTPILNEPTAAQTPRQVWMARLKTGGVISLLSLFLLTALWFSGGYLWWARLTAPKPPASDVIATFAGGQILISDVEAHLQLLLPNEYQTALNSPETLLAVIEDMVTDEMVRRWAATRQPDQDETFGHTMQHINESLNLKSLDLQLHENEIPIAESEIQDYYQANQTQFGGKSLDEVREEIRQTLVSDREQGYIEDYIQRLKDNASIARNFELLNVPAPSEDDLRRYYDANLETFKLPRQAEVDEIQFPISGDERAARKDADDALLKVRSGATFDEVAQAISRASVKSGTLVPEETRDPAWDTAVFALTPGELSDVFQAGDSFYIARLNDLQPARTKSLDEVRPSVLAAVQQQKTDEWFKTNASKTLVSLKGKQFTLGQFYQEYQELPPSTQTQYAGPQGMEKLAETLIERLLIVEDTYDQLLDVGNKPLADESRLQVLKQMMHQEEVDDKLLVSDEEMQKYYDDNLSLMSLPPKARIRYIRIGLGQTEDEQKAAQTRADEAYKKLAPGLFQQGAAFADTAKEYSEDPDTAAQGGELPDWIGESNDILAEVQLHPFHEVALALQPDEISRPFQSGDSLYIIQVIERTEAKQLPFKEAKLYIEEILTQQKHDEQLTQIQDKLLKDANFVVYPTVLEAYFQQLPMPTPFK